jgi:hypothetical protein
VALAGAGRSSYILPANSSQGRFVSTIPTTLAQVPKSKYSVGRIRVRMIS